MRDGLSQETYQDWPIRGPRTSRWCSEFMRKRNSCLDHHQLWKATAKLQTEQWAVGEHESLLYIMELAGTYDQLDLANLAFAEAAYRRNQVIEWAYVDKMRDATVVAGNSRLEQ